MITVEQSVEAVDMMRAALFEMGYPDAAVRPTSPDKRALGFRVDIARDLDRDAAWMACALSGLRQFGAEFQMICRPCAVRHLNHVCPRYPVGGLLAGASKGCAS